MNEALRRKIRAQLENHLNDLIVSLNTPIINDLLVMSRYNAYVRMLIDEAQETLDEFDDYWRNQVTKLD